MSQTRTRLGTVSFRKECSAERLGKLLDEHEVIEVGVLRGRPAAMVVEPELFERLEDGSERFDQLRAVLPVVVAALAAGVALPIETLERLDLDLPDDTLRLLGSIGRPGHVTGGDRSAPRTRVGIQERLDRPHPVSTGEGDRADGDNAYEIRPEWDADDAVSDSEAAFTGDGEQRWWDVG